MVFNDALSTATIQTMLRSDGPLDHRSCDARFALTIMVSFKKVDFQIIRDNMMLAALDGQMSYCMVFSITNIWQYLQNNRPVKVFNDNKFIHKKYPPTTWLMDALPQDLKSTKINIVFNRNLDGPITSAAGTVEQYPFYEITFDWSSGVRNHLISRKLDVNRKDESLAQPAPAKKARSDCVVKS